MATELPAGEHIFHLALESDWEQAKTVGEYRVSTLGRTLEQEGFLHACRAHQVDGVLARYYSGVTVPLVLLEADPTLIGVPLVLEVPAGADEAFPHVYGPLPVGAVVSANPWP